MKNTKQGHKHLAGPNQKKGPFRGPYWRHVHHHWYFWVGVMLMIVAIGTYVITEDLSWVPRNQPQQPLPSASGK